MKAIIIGSIGALCETSEIQRQCFNQALEEHDTGLYWNVAQYCALIRAPGGLARLQNLGIEDEVAKAIHNRKQALFTDAIKGVIAPRAGIIDLINECQKQNIKKQEIKLGFVTTTTPVTLQAIIEALSPVIDFDLFDIITDASHAGKPKPHPDIYHHALEALGIKAHEALVIEDSEANANAAQKAGLTCLFTPGEYQLADSQTMVTASYDACASLFGQAA